MLIELADQVIFVTEVTVDGARRHLGFLGNHGNGQTVETLLAENFMSRIENAFFLVHDSIITTAE